VPEPAMLNIVLSAILKFNNNGCENIDNNRRLFANKRKVRITTYEVRIKRPWFLRGFSIRTGATLSGTS